MVVAQSGSGSISAFVNEVGRCELCIRKEMEVSGSSGLL